MNTTMKAVTLLSPGELSLQEREIPVCSDGEVLIRTAYCGICGSDVGIVYSGAKTYPLVLGHEFTGSVVAVGNEQDASLIGASVTAYPIIACGVCPQCKNADYTKCANYNFVGSRCDGAYAEYVKVPRENIIVLNGISPLDGVLIEPLAVGVHAVNRAGRERLERCVIIGAGTIGLMTAMACRICGAKEVLLIDLDENKLRFAEQLGFCVVNSACVNPVDAVGTQYPQGATAIFECTGVAAVLPPAIEYAAPDAAVVLVGMIKKDVVLPPTALRSIMKKEIDLTGSWVSNYDTNGESDWSTAMSAIADGLIRPGDFIASIISQDEIAESLREMHEHPSKTRKIVIDYTTGRKQE